MNRTPKTGHGYWNAHVLSATSTSQHFREETGWFLRDNASRWQELLAHPAARTRPSDDVWSGLEYACHVRDVFDLYDRRLVMMLEQDDPLYPNWDQNETAIAERYDEQDPSRVSDDLTRSAETLSDRFDALSEGDWARTGTRSDGARFTVEAFARYLVHDPVHHVLDVERGYERLEKARP